MILILIETTIWEKKRWVRIDLKRNFIKYLLRLKEIGIIQIWKKDRKDTLILIL